LSAIDVHRAAALGDAISGALSDDPNELLGGLGVRLLVGDARDSGLQGGSVDLFVSNNTLEHIPNQTLRGILGEFRRLASPEAVMDHFIDMSDHYAHFDSAITEFNYMRYSDSVWRLFNNRLQYQNRLRLSDYRRLIEDAGFQVVAENAERGSMSELKATKLAQRFRGYPLEELIVLRCWLTAAVGDARRGDENISGSHSL
jgi:hypothetical protein